MKAKDPLLFFRRNVDLYLIHGSQKRGGLTKSREDPVHQGVGNSAMFYVDKTVGSFLIIADGFLLHLQLHPEAILIGVRGRNQRYGRHLPQSSQSFENILQDSPLELSLQGGIDVLPLTTPATTKVRTRRVYSPGRRFQKAYHLSEGISLLLLGDLNQCFLSCESVGDEHNLAVHTGDAIAPKSHGVDGYRRLANHGTSVARPKARIQCIGRLQEPGKRRMELRIMGKL
jgi:hypothetical protein